MTLPTVDPLDHALHAALQARVDGKTKPPGSLGRLEALAVQAGLAQNRLDPQVSAPTLLVFAADHGAAQAGVSAYPQAVTAQMVANFLAGGAAINVFARQAGLALTVVNAGVAHPIARPAQIVPGVAFVDQPIAAGTHNYLHRPAMSPDQCEQALAAGAALATRLAAGGCNTLGCGEMGIGNTASASLLTHLLCDVPLAAVVGRGTGLDDAGLARKRALLMQALARTEGRRLSAREALTEYGGFEIAMMAGAFVAAAAARMLILVDGFIATAALLVARALAPAVLEYCVFSHRSQEPGHRVQLAALNASPLLDLDLRLGEGTGAALALPLLRAALAMLREMASFDSAGVSAAAG